MLAQDVTRKSYCFYWQFENLGPELLSREEVWLVGGILRTTVVKEVVGGVSAVFKLWLARFFQSGHDFRSGVFVQCAMGSFMVAAVLNTVLADEAALKAIWDTKGSSGLKPCMHCMNVCSVRSELEGGRFVSVSCHTPSKFRAFSDSSLWQAADKLAELAQTHCSKSALEDLEKALGLCYDAAGILWDLPLRRAVRPISVSIYDWCHIFVASGVGNTALWQFLKHAKRETELTFSDIDRFMQNWNWPAATRNLPKACFSRAREKACHEADKFKCGASEFLDLYPVLRSLVEVYKLEAHIPLQVRALLGLFRVLDLLLACSFAIHEGSHDLLCQATTTCMRLHKRAYPEQILPWKWHAMMHIPDQMRKPLVNHC